MAPYFTSTPTATPPSPTHHPTTTAAQPHSEPPQPAAPHRVPTTPPTRHRSPAPRPEVPAPEEPPPNTRQSETRQPGTRREHPTEDPPRPRSPPVGGPPLHSRPPPQPHTARHDGGDAPEEFNRRGFAGLPGPAGSGLGAYEANLRHPTASTVVDIRDGYRHSRIGSGPLPHFHDACTPDPCAPRRCRTTTRHGRAGTTARRPPWSLELQTAAAAARNATTEDIEHAQRWLVAEDEWWDDCDDYEEPAETVHARSGICNSEFARAAFAVLGNST